MGLVGLEPTLPEEVDFKSTASADSAIPAPPGNVPSGEVGCEDGKESGDLLKG